MDLRTWPDGPKNPKIFERFYSERACEWHYGVNPVIRLKANPLVNEVEERLNRAVQRNPTSPQAVKDLCEYQGRKRNIRAHKDLRRFRRSAVNGGKQFFQNNQNVVTQSFPDHLPTTHSELRETPPALLCG